MIAADTSVLIDYFQGKQNPASEKLDEIFTLHSLVLPPTVLVEILSDPNLPKKFVSVHDLFQLPTSFMAKLNPN